MLLKTRTSAQLYLIGMHSILGKYQDKNWKFNELFKTELSLWPTYGCLRRKEETKEGSPHKHAVGQEHTLMCARTRQPGPSQRRLRRSSCTEDIDLRVKEAPKKNVRTMRRAGRNTSGVARAKCNNLVRAPEYVPARSIRSRVS